eukprot:SAG31_NODE_377_length_16533_cov_99.867957_5_plen_167_part_00
MSVPAKQNPAVTELASAFVAANICSTPGVCGGCWSDCSVGEQQHPWKIADSLGGCQCVSPNGQHAGQCALKLGLLAASKFACKFSAGDRSHHAARRRSAVWWPTGCHVAPPAFATAVGALSGISISNLIDVPPAVTPPGRPPIRRRTRHSIQLQDQAAAASRHCNF